MQEELHIEDGSNDRMYFTMVPNYILNHSTGIDQALYLQMKRFAGEKSGGGYCSASHRTLMKKLGIGHPVLKKSLKYLIDHKWIEERGVRKVQTEGGIQDVQVYRVNDIWKLNTEHYQGVAESTHHDKVLIGSNTGVAENAQGVAKQQPIKNVLRTKELPVAIAPALSIQRESEYEELPKTDTRRAKDKLAVYHLFSKREQPWWRFKHEREAALSLFDLVGIESVANGLSVMREHSDDKYCPQAATPREYAEQREPLKRYMKRNGL